VETIAYDVDGPVATITLDRPDALNTIVPPMRDEFAATISRATGDLVIASEDAIIGTPYSRVWGCYLSGMWIYRLGLTKAKEHALTGKPRTGREAADIQLIKPRRPVRRTRGHGRRAGSGACSAAGIPARRDRSRSGWGHAPDARGAGVRRDRRA
jgi:enoyl-CoA hydratase/carnithine racemase